MDENLKKLFEEKMQQAGEGDFCETVMKTFRNVKEKSGKNRDKHFKIKKSIISFSAAVSIANVLVTFCGYYQILSGLIPLITGISSIFSILVTAFIAVKETKKYSETWIRHRIHLSDMELEIIKFTYGIKEYTSADTAAVNVFKAKMYEIWEKNTKRYENNMQHFNNE